MEFIGGPLDGHVNSSLDHEAEGYLQSVVSFAFNPNRPDWFLPFRYVYQKTGTAMRLVQIFKLDSFEFERFEAWRKDKLVRELGADYQNNLEQSPYYFED